MSRAYLRMDPAFAERKAHYPDGAFRALVEVICLAEYQPNRGRFRSIKLLTALLERRGRWVAFLRLADDIRVEDDGRVYVVGWDEWQEGDHTVRERVQRIRNRRRPHGPSNGPSNGSGNGPDRIHPAIARFSLSKESGSEAISGAPLSDEEQREQLDRLRDTLSAKGLIPPPKPTNGKTAKPAETDEQMIARYQAIVADAEAPDWKRDAAKTELELLGVR